MPQYRTHERFTSSDQLAIQFHLILAGLKVDQANMLTVEELRRRQPRAPPTMAVASYVYGVLEATVKSTSDEEKTTLPNTPDTEAKADTQGQRTTGTNEEDDSAQHLVQMFQSPPVELDTSPKPIFISEILATGAVLLILFVLVMILFM